MGSIGTTHEGNRRINQDTHTCIQKSTIPSFASNEASIEMSMPNLSATNAPLQAYPLYGLSINSYLRQSLAPPSLYDKPTTLSTAKQSGYDLGLPDPDVSCRTVRCRT
jgi:hypothetical protein